MSYFQRMMPNFRYLQMTFIAEMTSFPEMIYLYKLPFYGCLSFLASKTQHNFQRPDLRVGWDHSSETSIIVTYILGINITMPTFSDVEKNNNGISTAVFLDNFLTEFMMVQVVQSWDIRDTRIVDWFDNGQHSNLHARVVACLILFSNFEQNP